MNRVLPISVLMSVYGREGPAFLEAALQSIADQTRPPAEVVLVEDGPLNDKLYAVLEQFEPNLPLSRLRRKVNRGLGLSLQEGLALCRYEHVARMDSDDIARPDRLATQYDYIESTGVDLVGSVIEEFQNRPGDMNLRRALPLDHDTIHRTLPRRNCFNHMTVMFRKSAVLSAGSYRDELYFEDYGLWLRMRKQGARFANLPDVHVDARIGNGFVERRSGIHYARREAQSILSFWRQGLIGHADLAVGLLVRPAVRLLPKSIFGRFYASILRRAS